MARIKQIIDVIEDFAPLDLQLDYDNCGLKFGDITKECTGVLVTLDTNEKVVEEAHKKGCNLIIEHHPSIWGGIKYLDFNMPLTKAMVLAIKYDIALYSAHTNIDFTNNGLNDYVAKQIGIINPQYVELPEDPRVGDLGKETTLKEYAEKLKAVFNDNNVTTIGDLDKKIKRVGIVNGGGGSSPDEMLKAFSKNVDVFVTGDVKYNVSRLAKDIGYAIIQVGHFNSEQGFMPLVKQVIDDKKLSVEVYCTECLENPYNN